MKLVKAIVATAVIVFALTTVAMAGVQRLGHTGDAAAAAQAQPAAAGAAAQPAGPVTLSARQFAALLGAVAREGERDRAQKKVHQRSAARTHTRDETRTHTTTRMARHAQDGTSSGSGDSTRHTATQTQTHAATRTQTHATHGGGSPHDGGCD